MQRQETTNSNFKATCPRLPSRLAFTVVLSYSFSFEKAVSRSRALSTRTSAFEQDHQAYLKEFCVQSQSLSYLFKDEIFKAAGSTQKLGFMR